MNVCVVGLGFVGLSMSTVIASKGFKVFGVETNEDKYSLIAKGKTPFFEPKIDDLLTSTLGKQLKVTTKLKEAASNSEIIFICVGTPSKSDGSADLRFIKKISKEIGEIVKQNSEFKIIVVKSTVPPNTTSKLVKTIIENTFSKKFPFERTLFYTFLKGFRYYFSCQRNG